MSMGIPSVSTSPFRLHQAQTGKNDEIRMTNDDGSGALDENMPLGFRVTGENRPRPSCSSSSSERSDSGSEFSAGMTNDDGPWST